MPNNTDFSVLENVHFIDIQPDGWKPIIIEYGIKNDAMPLYCWRVKGTQHTFTIPVVRLDFISSGIYEAHFKQTLEIFREYYIKWKKEGFPTNWAREYESQFSKFILDI
jgi:hypothetical protein